MSHKAIVVTGWRDALEPVHGRFIRDRLREARGPTVKYLFHGDARGVDRIAKTWAAHAGLTVRAHKANWGYFGASAGPIRNMKMVEAAIAEFGREGVLGVAFPHVSSIGTLHCISKFEQLGVTFKCHELWTPKTVR